MAYVYKNPVTSGYKRIYLTNREHNTFFKYLKTNWLTRYEYYISDRCIKIHRFTSRIVIIITILLFPVFFLIHGVANYKEIITDMKRLLNEKKYGAFVETVIFSKHNTYKEIKSLTIGK